MKKPKCIIAKQDYSVLTVLGCGLIGSIMLLIVVWSSAQGTLVERLLYSAILGVTALGAGWMLWYYIKYLKYCFKKEAEQSQAEEHDDAN